MPQHREFSNVYVLADKVTAAFFSASGANTIDFEATNLEALFKFLAEEGCELLIITENYWDEVKKHADARDFPPILLIPPVTGERGKAFDRLKDLAEQAIGIDIITPKKKQRS